VRRRSAEVRRRRSAEVGGAAAEMRSAGEVSTAAANMAAAATATAVLCESGPAREQGCQSSHRPESTLAG